MMTDNEIIKALECCVKNKGCDDCPLYAKESCFVVEEKALLDLINRKDAEIERLKPFEKKVLEPIVVNLKELEVAKSEAIKEFAERLKETADHEKYYDSYDGEMFEYTISTVDCDDIDNLVKEMTEQNDFKE